MAPPESWRVGSAGKHNGKRVRQCATTATGPGTAADRVLNVLEVHDLAYWCQWRLAILHVSARFEAAAQVESGTWCREQLEQVSISQQAALSSEVRHLESQLGKHTSMNAKLEAALSVNAEALGKTESARVAATAAVSRLQAQILYDKESAAVSARELEEKLSRSKTAQEGLAARIHEAETARLAAELKAAELLRRSSQVEVELSEALSATDKALEESLAERARVEAMQGDLANLREKYSTLKRRYLDAGRKVEAVRAERDALRLEHASLEDKLADVERFQTSERGQALDRMEQELATEKMARVELEADRDDLQSQLAAALQATAPA